MLGFFGAGCKKRARVPAPATPPPALSPAALAEAGAAVAELEREFAAPPEVTPARRIEIIYEIALQPVPAAIDALRRIRRSSTDPELREHLTRALAFSFRANPDTTLVLFRELLARDEPADARTIAAETLREIESPLALPLWRELEKDADPDLQETARAAVEYLTGLFPGR